MLAKVKQGHESGVYSVLEQIIFEYCRAIDQRDYDALRKICTSESVFDYSDAGLGWGPLEDMIPRLKLASCLNSFSLHLVSNINIIQEDSKFIRTSAATFYQVGIKLCPINPLVSGMSEYEHSFMFDESAQLWKLYSVKEKVVYLNKVPPFVAIFLILFIGFHLTKVFPNLIEQW